MTSGSFSLGLVLRGEPSNCSLCRLRDDWWVGCPCGGLEPFWGWAADDVGGVGSEALTAVITLTEGGLTGDSSILRCGVLGCDADVLAAVSVD